MYGDEAEPAFFEQPWYARSHVVERLNQRVEHLNVGEGSD